MLKKALLVLFLAIQFGVIVNVATADAPMPGCFPCNDGDVR
jgi:hypothetical protein